MDDRELLRQFEDCTLPFMEWNHRTHVKVGFLNLCDHPFAEALESMRNGVKAYNAANDVPEGPRQGYNETTTHAFMQLIDSTMKAYGDTLPTPNADAFCDAHPQLLCKFIVRLFYSPERWRTPEAKLRFIEPDLAPLPRIPDAD